jgi:hypothetical protein
MSKEPVGLLERVDHLLWAVPDLDAAIVDLEARLGVRAAIGGRHPAWGTRNAIIPLGPRIYFELFAPDPDAPAPSSPRPLGLDTLTAPRLATWVASGTDLPRLAADARAAGIDLGEAASRGRERPDGLFLSWTMTDAMKERAGGVIPFFIDWADSPHPGSSGPATCRLVDLRADHPEPDLVRRQLGILGLDLPVSPGASPRLFATLDTPRGVVILS